MTRRGEILHRVLGVLSRGLGVSFGVGAIGLAGAIALVASEQPGRAGSAPQPPMRPQIAERQQPRPLPGPSNIVVLVRSEEQAALVREHLGDVGNYHGGLPASFLIA